tara:strand:+ start:683 stop:1135 length:453 start_codon:yes stop_codon:yes gene_type:complete
MYIKAIDNVILEPRYSLRKLKQDNPNTSFPDKPDASQLAEWDVYRVVRTEQPVYDSLTSKIVPATAPTLVNGVWTLGWVVIDKTVGDRAEEASAARTQRNELLRDCDWTQLADSPLDRTTKAAWVAYRAELRAIPKQASFPDIIDWPTTL